LQRKKNPLFSYGRYPIVALPYHYHAQQWTVFLKKNAQGLTHPLFNSGICKDAFGCA